MTDRTLFDFDPDAVPADEHTITVVHQKERHDTYGGRARGGRSMAETKPRNRGWLGNPFRLADYDRDTSIEMFRDAFYDRLVADPEFTNAVLAQMGKRVACWCRRSDETEPACHLDVVKAALEKGHVLWIAGHIHDIPLTPTERHHMADERPEEVGDEQ